MKYHLQVQIEPLAEGGYLALCSQIAGCHAEGATIGEAIDNLHSVAHAINDLCRAHGLSFVSDAPDATLEQITWCIEISPSPQPVSRVGHACSVTPGAHPRSTWSRQRTYRGRPSTAERICRCAGACPAHRKMLSSCRGQDPRGTLWARKT